MICCVPVFLKMYSTEPLLSPNAPRDATFALAIAYYQNHEQIILTRKVAMLYRLEQSGLVRRTNGKI